MSQTANKDHPMTTFEDGDIIPTEYIDSHSLVSAEDIRAVLPPDGISLDSLVELLQGAIDSQGVQRLCQLLGEVATIDAATRWVTAKPVEPRAGGMEETSDGERARKMLAGKTSVEQSKWATKEDDKMQRNGRGGVRGRGGGGRGGRGGKQDLSRPRPPLPAWMDAELIAKVKRGQRPDSE